MAGLTTTTMTTTVLITGANRGIGYALAAAYLLRPSHVVIACVRNPSTASSLASLPVHASSKLLTTTIDSSDFSSAHSAVAELQRSHGITSLDIVYANAGVSTVYPPAAEASPEDLRAHFEINALGPLALFQATLALLRASSNPVGGRFIAMSSSAASIGGMERRPVPNSAYGTSKAALNYLLRKMHFESDGLVIVAVDPGWVRTDMGNRAAHGWGLAEAETSVEESVAGVVKITDEATRGGSGGKFLLFSGGEWAW